MNWVWPCTSTWQSGALLKQHPIHHTRCSWLLYLSISFSKVQLLPTLQKLLISSFSLTLYLPSWENEKQQQFYPFLAFFCRSSWWLHIQAAGWGHHVLCISILVQSPLCGTVTHVMYLKKVLCMKKFESQPKAVLFLQISWQWEFVSFGNIPIHFTVTVIV